MSKMAKYYINQPSGRAVTRSFNLPWSSGDDFRLSLKLISAGDRGSIPRGRVSFLQLDDVPVLLFCRFKLRIVYAIKMVVQVMIMKIEHLTRGLVGAKTYLI